MKSKFQYLGFLMLISTSLTAHENLGRFCLGVLNLLWNSPAIAFHAGDTSNRTIVHEDGGTVHENITWFGLVRYIDVTYPDGTHVRYARTDRGITNLRNDYVWPASLIDVVELRGKKVLDYAASDGAFVNELRRSGIDAHGVDIYLTSAQLRQNHFRLTNGNRIPYEDASFDTIYCNWSVFQYELGEGNVATKTPKKLLIEMSRVLRPGGVLRISPIAGRRVRLSDGSIGAEYTELEILLREVPGLRIRRRPDSTWLSSVRYLERPGDLVSPIPLQSEIWVEMERIP